MKKKRSNNSLVAALIILAAVLGGGAYLIAHAPQPESAPATSTSAAQTAVTNDTAQASASHIDWTAPGYTGTLVTLDSETLNSASSNPTLRGTAKGFAWLNIGVMANGRDGSAIFNLDPIPVVDGKWSVRLVPGVFNNPSSGNVFNDAGELPNGSYNVQIFPGPTYSASSLINATLNVHAR